MSATARRPSHAPAGQASIEYVLLVGIAALVSLFILSAVTPLVQEGILAFNAQLEKELVSGGFNEAGTMWEN